MSYRAHVLLAGPGPMISPTSIVHSGPHLCSQVIFPPRPEVPLQQTVSVRSLSHHPVSRGAPIQAPVPPVRLVTVRAYEPQGGAEFHFYSRLEPTIPKRFDQYPESMMASPSYGGASDDQSRPKWNNSHYTQHLLASKGQGEYGFPQIAKEAPKIESHSYVSTLSSNFSDTASVRSAKFVNFDFGASRHQNESVRKIESSSVVSLYSPAPDLSVADSALKSFDSRRADEKSTQSFKNIFFKASNTYNPPTESFLGDVFLKKVNTTQRRASQQEIDFEKNNITRLIGTSSRDQSSGNFGSSNVGTETDEDALSNRDLFLKRLRSKPDA